MTLSEHSWNAIMSMVMLASSSETQALRLKDLQDELHLSRPYTEHIMAMLRKAGLVEGVRGTGGGYYLTRALHKTTLADVVAAVEEPNKYLSWLQKDGDNTDTLKQKVWQQLEQQLHTLLAGITLAELVKKPAVVSTKRLSHTTNMIAHMFPARRSSKDTELEAAAAF